MQDETQRSAAEEAEERMPEAESVLPTAPEVSVGDVQTLGGAATRAARKAELKPGQEKPRQMKVGRVVSDKMQKTVIVAVEYTRPHPLYKKAMKRTSKFAAHDDQNLCKIGDIVRIEETRPLSKTKRWIVREIIKRGIVV
jgi:small subunit ribosomal protein S17